MTTVHPSIDEIRDSVTKVCLSSLGISEVGLDEDLTRLGANSLMAAEIIGELELEFHVDVIAEFFAGPTVRQVSDAIHTRLQTP